MKGTLPLSALIAACALSAYSSQTFPVPDAVVRDALAGRKGSFVIVECATGRCSDFDAKASAEKFPPCSTFKVWNTLFGIEAGLITAPENPFYTWDGVKRDIAGWNRNLTVQEAFQASCVPAFQELARKLGRDALRAWIEKIGYGDGNISSGADVFWLPAKGRRPILISAMEQAQLLCRLANGELPFSDRSIQLLKAIMTARKTHRGTLYGKTGTGSPGEGTCNVGWFVGLIADGHLTYAFACNIQGDGVMGADARAITEKILEKQGLL